MNALADLWIAPDEKLFHIIESDDLILEQSDDAVWFQLVKSIFEQWQQYLPIAVEYYQALYQFNQNGTTDYQQRKAQQQKNSESKEEAQLLFLLDRPTAGNDDKPKVFESLTPPKTSYSVDENAIRPGQVPSRLYGRKPKDFFSMYAAFCATQVMGIEATAENVNNYLTGNPSFARACNFTQPNSQKERFTDIPSLRKLEQFDQIMTENGIWNEAKNNVIEENLKNKTIVPEKNLVHDTTHHIAFSGFETVPYTDENGKNKKKSQSHMTKVCSCPDKQTCSHSWELADDGAGTVVKKHNVFYWAHKASIIGLPDQGIPLVAQAMNDAASHDMTSIVESMELLKKLFPEVAEEAVNLLDDSAADDPKLKASVKEQFDVTLRCPVNPRRSKTLKADQLPKAMISLTPRGILRCIAGHEMEYLGSRTSSSSFCYGPPCDEQGKIKCNDCPLKSECCHTDNSNGRHVNIPFGKLSNISFEDPPMAKRFQKLMKKRPSVERMIYRLKCILGERYLSKRGNQNYQATLDKSMLVLHLLLRQ